MSSISETVTDDDWDSTAGKVIKLNTADDLKKLATITNGGKDPSGRTFALGADIDMTSVSSFSPIGERNSFKGIFDGQGFTISGLKVENQLSALFSQTDGATINNVVLNNIDINGQGLVTGGLIAVAYNTNLKSCFVTGKITDSGYSSTGGLIGKAQTCIIKDCSTDITIERTEAGGSDYRNIGGFIGDADKNCTIENCIAKGSITCSVNSKKSLSVGGFIGYNDANNIENCASTVNIIVTGSGETSEQYIGGFVGKSRSGSIKNCISAGKLDNSCIGTRRKTGSFCSYVISGENNKYQYNTTYDLSNSGTTSTSIKGFSNRDNKDAATYVANIAPSEFPSPKKPTAKDKYSDDPTPTPSSKKTTDYCRFNLQVGINSTENSVIEIDTGFKLGDFTISLLDSEDGTIKGDENARKALDTIDALMTRVTNKMTDIASIQNRIESVIEFQEVQRNALTSANSLIKDADIALESANYLKNQILQNVTSALLSTANQSPQIALQLI